MFRAYFVELQWWGGKREERCGGLGSLLGVKLAAYIAKAEPRPKAAHFEEVIQGWPLNG